MKKFLKYLGRRIGGVLPVAIFLVFTFCIYMPCSLYLGNIGDFNMDFKHVVPIIVKISTIVFASVFVLGLLMVHERVSVSYLGLVFGVALGFYVQGNFLNADYGTLNGHAIDWDNFTTAGVISIAGWVFCIVGTQVLIAWKRQIAIQVMRWGSLALTAMQISAFVVTLMNAQTTAVNGNVAITKKDQFVLSSKENIVYFVIDTLDCEFFDDVLEAEPEYKELLKDFTYYDNCIAEGAPTICGVPSLLTGTQYTDLSKNFDQYRIDAYLNNPLFLDMKQNNYVANIYTNEIGTGIQPEYVDNYQFTDEFIVADEWDFAAQLYKFTAFYASPQLLKRQFLFYTDDIKRTIKAKDVDEEIYYLDDPTFFEEFKEQGITLKSDRNRFKFYHFYGSHPPFVSNERMERIGEKDSDISTSDRLHQNLGEFYMVTQFIDEMKKLGIYDNSTIVITADHGFNELDQNPTVLIKGKNEHGTGSFKTVSTPVTFSNLYATIDSVVVGDTLDTQKADDKANDDNKENVENKDSKEDKAFEEYLSRRNQMIEYRKSNDFVINDDKYYDACLADVPDVQRDRYLTVHIIAKEFYPDNADVNDSTFTRVKFTGAARDVSKVSIIGTTNNPKQ